MLLRFDIKKPLINLEYIFKEYGIPVSLLYDLKEKCSTELFLKKFDNSFEIVFSVYDNNTIIDKDGCVTMIDDSDKEYISKIREMSINAEVPVILEMDSILDKISKYGTNSLVKEEFEYLFNYK